MVGLSLLLFIAYVSSMLRLMQVGPVVDRIAREALHVVGGAPAGEREPAPLAAETAWVAYQGRAGVLRDVNVARLVRVARRQGVVLRLIPRIGDFVVPGTPMLAVHGGAEPSRRALRYTVSVGVERTFHQDLGFGLRQLSDIALRALSPAVNDPTTAVQCLDRIVQFLAVVVQHAARGGAPPGPARARCGSCRTCRGGRISWISRFAEVRLARGGQSAGHPAAAGRDRRSAAARARGAEGAAAQAPCAAGSGGGAGGARGGRAGVRARARPPGDRLRSRQSSGGHGIRW